MRNKPKMIKIVWLILIFFGLLEIITGQQSTCPNDKKTGKPGLEYRGKVAY